MMPGFLSAIKPRGDEELNFDLYKEQKSDSNQDEEKVQPLITKNEQQKRKITTPCRIALKKWFEGRCYFWLFTILTLGSLFIFEASQFYGKNIQH
jgi:hypothetical protein